MLEPTPETRAPEAGPSSGGPTSIEHLDNLCRLMEKLGELRDHNSQLQRRVQYLEDLKGLRGHAEAGTATAEEAIMKATEERFLGPASSSNARPFVKIGKRSGKFKPLQYSMSHTFGEEGAKRKESKWSKVKGALGLDRSSTAILKQTSPCSSAGQSPQVKRSPLKPVEPDSSGSSSSEELDPYFTLTDISPDYDVPAATTNSQLKLEEEGYRRSKSLEGEALFNHLRGVSTCQRPNRTPWGVVKGLIKTAKSHRHENSRLSYPSEAPEDYIDPTINVAEDVRNSVPDDNNFMEEFTNGQCRMGSTTSPRRPSKWSKVKSAFLSGPPITTSPNRHSSFLYDPDWDVSEEVASVPKDEIRRSYLNLQQRLSQEFQRKRMNWERGVGVISENSSPLENDQESVANIYAEVSDLSPIKKSSTSVSIMDEQQYRNQVNPEGRESMSPQPAGLLAWQRLRKSLTVPALPLTEITNGAVTKAKVTNDIPVVPENCSDSQERGLRWLQKELSRVEREKMRLERERDRVLRREAKQRRQEVLVRTSGGLFRFQGISHQFTRRLFEWEKSQGIPPQDSTLALLHPEYADSTDVSNKLERSRSEGIVGARVPRTNEDESTGVRNKILRFENSSHNKMDSPPRLLRPKDFKSRFSERCYHDEGDVNSSSTTQEHETADLYGLNDASTGICKSRFRPKVRARGKFVRQNNLETENNFANKQQATNTEENQDQRHAAVLVSALSTQLLTLAQELEASLGPQPSQSQSNCNIEHSVQPKLAQCPDAVTPLPTLLTNTVLQLRQGLKVLCKDHGGSSSNLNSCPEPEKIPSIHAIDKEDFDEEDEEDDGEDEDDDDSANIRRYTNKRKLRKISRKISCNDPSSTSADVFVPTTRRIFSPITHEDARLVVVDEPTKDSDSSSTASSDPSERVSSPPVPVPMIPTLTTTSASLHTWRTPSVRNVCSIVTPAWLRTSGSRSQSSSPATRRRPTPPALPQSPGTTRRDKDPAAPSIRMMIAKYNQNPTENGVAASGGSWKSTGVEKRVRLQMERYEQGIRLESSGCVQKSASAGAIRPPGILKSSSVGSIKPRVIPSVMAARLRNIRIQRAKLDFLSRSSPESAVPLIKSASESVIECSKPVEPENHGPDASPKMSVGWRLRRINRSIDEESAATSRQNVVSTGTTKSCPSSPVLERIGTEEKDSGRSPVGWIKLPGRLFRQK